MNAVTRTKPKANSRNKGASFERAVAIELELITGIRFARDLEQYRAADHGDLIPSDPAWPFITECKAYAAGTGCKPEWIAQASKAAVAVGKMPCVVYKYDRRPVRVALPMAAVAQAFGGSCALDTWVETSVAGLAYIAAEIMAGRSC